MGGGCRKVLRCSRGRCLGCGLRGRTEALMEINIDRASGDSTTERVIRARPEVKTQAGIPSGF